MTVVRRDGRPRRPMRHRGAQTGLLALLALGAGGGCGEVIMRQGPQKGPGIAAESLGLVSRARPGPAHPLARPGQGPRCRRRRHGWGEGVGRLEEPGGRTATGELIMSNRPRAGDSADGLRREVLREDVLERLEAPRPVGLAPAASVASALGDRPTPISSPNIPTADGASDPLLTASHESRLDPPLQRLPAAAVVTGSALEGLMEALPHDPHRASRR